jgi:hypothetical protein
MVQVGVDIDPELQVIEKTLNGAHEASFMLR